MKISAAVDPQFRLPAQPMVRAYVAAGCLLLALITATSGRGESPHESTPHESTPHESTPHESTLGERVAPLYRQDLSPLTAASCASSSCHGGTRPGVTDASAAGRAAYPLWLQRDPHARSWKTLCGPDSVAIMTRLGILDGDRISDQAGLDNCLACHNTHRSQPVSTLPVGTLPEPSATPVRLTFAPRHTEGVGCAACHGPAEQWIGAHFVAGWQGELATDQGFVANDDLVTRARMCASCHVGDYDRDLNHDLIAAGHPVLRFEMASHHSRLPKHWRDPGAEDRAAFEARLWSAGAVASADAWLALQQGRAQHSTPVSTWPELAAHDCSSCHQALRLNSDRDPLCDPGRRGSAKMARWDVASVLLSAHADLVSADRGAATTANELLSRLDRFRGALEVMPAGSAIDVATTAAEVRRQLALYTAAASQSWNTAENHHRLARRRPANDLLELFVRSAPRAEATQTWESAAQVYLLLAASQYQWPHGVAPKLQEHAAQMRLGLSLPDGLDSPRYSLAVPLGAELTREELRQLLQRIIATLEAEVDSLPPPVAVTPRRSELSRSTAPSALIKDASHVSVH